MVNLPFLTPEDLVPVLDMVRQILANQQAAAPPADDFMSVEQVATATNSSTKTVRKWLSKGKAGLDGKIIKLFALEFSPGYPRIPRSALLAFGQAQGFDASQLGKPVAEAAPAATKPKKRPVLDSKQALRRAS